MRFGVGERANIPTDRANNQEGDAAMPEQAQFFVGWGTLSLINAGLAQSKGRSGLLWWLVF